MLYCSSLCSVSLAGGLAFSFLLKPQLWSTLSTDSLGMIFECCLLYIL